MFPRNRGDTTRAEPEGGIIPRFTASSLCAYRTVPGRTFSKEPRPSHDGRRRGINISGVDFWHAVEFSRNGRFLCTHPRGLSSGRFPSVFRVSDSIRPFHRPISSGSCWSCVSLSGLSAFRRCRLYQILSGLTSSQLVCLPDPLGRSDVPNFSGSSAQFLIEWIRSRATQFRIEFGHAESNPVGRSCWWLGAAFAAEGAVAEPLRPRGNPKNFTDRGGGCQAPPVNLFSRGR